LQEGVTVWQIIIFHEAKVKDREKLGSVPFESAEGRGGCASELKTRYQIDEAARLIISVVIVADGRSNANTGFRATH
jgi:hypothetical protein